MLIAVLLYFNRAFKFKYGDGIYDLETFYALEDNSVDVLVLGTSHALEHFDTGELWDDHGIASYVLAGSAQPMWNTYYYLKEALKTQTPKLIILEGYSIFTSDDFADDATLIKNTYGLKPSADKLSALKESVPKDRLAGHILEYTQYHSRYTDLTKSDFLKWQGDPVYFDWKGFNAGMIVDPMEPNDVSKVTQKGKLYEKSERYYRKVIELAKAHNIPIMVVITPYSGVTDEQQMAFNTAGEIAGEYGIPFVNCNLFTADIGIDYNEDASDFNHLNYKGARKFSAYIGSYIKSGYDIPDRRGDSKYDSWERSARVEEWTVRDYEISACENITELTDKISTDGYWIIAGFSGDCLASEEQFDFLRGKLGIEEEDRGGIWFVNGGGPAWNSSMDEGEIYLSNERHDFHFKSVTDNEGKVHNTISIDSDLSNTKVENGLNIVIYDTVTEKTAGVFGINKDNFYEFIK